MQIEDSAAANLDLPDALPGLDIRDGLSRVLGRKGAFLKLLFQFIGRNRETAAEIRRLVGAGECEEARRQAHAVKGVSGNLGVHALHASAAALEAVLAEERAKEYESRLAEFSRALEEILSTVAVLQTMVGDALGPDAKEGAQEDHAQWSAEERVERMRQVSPALRARLAEALEVGVVAAIESLVAEVEDCNPALGKYLKSQVDEFAYAGILELIRRAQDGAGGTSAPRVK